LLVAGCLLLVYRMSVGGAGSNITVMSIVGDITDEHELRTGTRQEGIFLAR